MNKKEAIINTVYHFGLLLVGSIAIGAINFFFAMINVAGGKPSANMYIEVVSYYPALIVLLVSASAICFSGERKNFLSDTLKYTLFSVTLILVSYITIVVLSAIFKNADDYFALETIKSIALATIFIFATSGTLAYMLIRLTKSKIVTLIVPIALTVAIMFIEKSLQITMDDLINCILPYNVLEQTISGTQSLPIIIAYISMVVISPLLFIGLASIKKGRKK